MGAVLVGTSHEAKWSQGRGQTTSDSIDSDDNDSEVLENLAQSREAGAPCWSQGWESHSLASVFWLGFGRCGPVVDSAKKHGGPWGALQTEWQVRAGNWVCWLLAACTGSREVECNVFGEEGAGACAIPTRVEWDWTGTKWEVLGSSHTECQEFSPVNERVAHVWLQVAGSKALSVGVASAPTERKGTWLLLKNASHQGGFYKKTPRKKLLSWHLANTFSFSYCHMRPSVKQCFKLQWWGSPTTVLFIVYFTVWCKEGHW